MKSQFEAAFKFVISDKVPEEFLEAMKKGAVEIQLNIKVSDDYKLQGRAGVKCCGYTTESTHCADNSTAEFRFSSRNYEQMMFTRVKKNV